MYMYFVSMCLVQLLVVMLLAMNIAPMLSTLTVTGNLIEIFMLFSNWIMNIISFAASRSVTHSASELNNLMFFHAINHQKRGTSKAHKMNTLGYLW